MMSESEPPPMNQPPSVQTYQAPGLGSPEYAAMARQKDKDQLRLLSIFYYVLSGFAVLGLIFLIIHGCIMGVVFTMAAKDAEKKQRLEQFENERGVQESQSRDRSDADETAVMPDSTSSTESPDEIAGGTAEEEFNYEYTSRTQRNNGMPKEMMGPVIVIMAVVYLVGGAMIIGMGILNFMCARRIGKCRSRTFCMVVAGVNCIQIPFGLALGICTFIVLGRQSVVELFAEAETGNAPEA